jgi:hypothetical protein
MDGWGDVCVGTRMLKTCSGDWGLCRPVSVSGGNANQAGAGGRGEILKDLRK